MALAGNKWRNWAEGQKDTGDRRELSRARAHEIDKELRNSTTSFRNAIAKPSEHSLLERGIRFFVCEFFFQDFVHDFVLLMSLTAAHAFDEMGVQRVLFLFGKLVVQIGSEVVIDVVVNRHGCSEARAGLSCLRIVASARPRIPRSEPFVRPSRFSIVA